MRALKPGARVELVNSQTWEGTGIWGIVEDRSTILAAPPVYSVLWDGDATAKGWYGRHELRTRAESLDDLVGMAARAHAEAVEDVESLTPPTTAAEAQAASMRYSAEMTVEQAAVQVARAEQALRTAVTEAHQQYGATVSELARHAGVTRQTIYRWIEDDSPSQ